MSTKTNVAKLTVACGLACGVVMATACTSGSEETDSDPSITSVSLTGTLTSEDPGTESTSDDPSGETTVGPTEDPTTGPTTGPTTSTTDDPTTSTTDDPTGNSTDDPCGELTMGCDTDPTGNPLPPDPCVGQEDGIYCGGNLGGLADHNSIYQCMDDKTLSAQPCPNGCANNLCNPVNEDPCASAQSGDGLYCGETLSGGSAGTLYQCQGGGTAGTENCANGCQVNPPGFSDACKPDSDLCQFADGGDGPYCGGSLQPGESENVLFECENMMTIGEQTCPNGCVMMPPGFADECAPNENMNECCLETPPGALTQAFTACGGGGSHYGIDYGTAIGTPIFAGMAGTVVGHALGYPNCYNNGCSMSCWNAFNYVKLKSDCGDPNQPGNDFYIYYLHIDGLAPGVGNGTHVDQNQLFAYAGNSGCSSGPHIHIETASVPQGQNAVLNTCSSQDPNQHYCN